MWEKSAQDIQPGRAGAAAPPGAGPASSAGAAAPAGAGPESLAGVRAPPGAGPVRLSGAAAPPGAGPVRLSGARGPAGVNPGPRKTLHKTDLQLFLHCLNLIYGHFQTRFI